MKQHVAVFLFLGLPEFCSVLDVLEIVALTCQVREDQRNFLLPFLLEFSKGVLSPASGRGSINNDWLWDQSVCSWSSHVRVGRHWRISRVGLPSYHMSPGSWCVLSGEWVLAQNKSHHGKGKRWTWIKILALTFTSFSCVLDHHPWTISPLYNLQNGDKAIPALQYCFKDLLI